MGTKRKVAGFTIVELLIVIVVIAILAAITIVAYSGIQNRAKDSQTDSNLSGVRKMLEMYYIDNGIYPAVCPGGDNSGCDANLLGPVLVPAYGNKLPDSYPNAYGVYQYVRGGGSFDSYAIYVRYYSKPNCKAGVKVASSWWGVGLATC